MIVTCPKCGHRWTPHTESPRLMCSHCNSTFPRPNPEIKLLARSVTLHANCTNCGRLMTDLNVCEINGEPAFLCSDCLGDPIE